MPGTVRLQNWFSFLFWACCCSFHGYAQSTNNIPAGYDAHKQPDFSVPSPTVASLGKFGLTPVAYYTGLPQITIPLWEVKGKELRVPITLNYNNNGLKVTEESSWVGLGWALQAGGMITQEVRGNADKLDASGTGYYGSSGILPYQQPPTPFSTTGSETLMNRFAQGIQDSSPDVFHYTFGQYSGRFILRDSTAKQLLYNDLQINYDYSNHRFTVVTGDGTVYKFFKREPTSNYNLTSGTTTTSSSWLLTEITSANGADTITLTYANTAETYTTPTGYTIDDNYAGYPVGNVANNINSNVQCRGYNTTSEYQTLSRSIATSYRLESIESQSELIRFVPQTATRLDVNAYNYATSSTGTAYALASIQVYDKTHQPTALVRAFNLYLSYFTTDYSRGTVTPRTGRLRLDSLQEVGSDNRRKSPYTFVYQDGQLPDRATRDLDHWGYYNWDGNNGNTSLVPATLRYLQGTAHREPVLRAALLTTLQKITYPTGGSESFIYEQNLYRPAADSVERAGPGLRIRQIISQSVIGAASYRTFSYVTPVDPWLTPQYEKALVNNPGTNCDCLLVTVSGRSPGLFNMFASILHYAQITENAGPTGEGGRTEYSFKEIADLDRANGMQQIKKITRSADQQLIREEESQYATDSDLSLPIFLNPTAIHGSGLFVGCCTLCGQASGSTCGDPTWDSLDGSWNNEKGCYISPSQCACGAGDAPVLAYKMDRTFNFKMSYYLPTFVNLTSYWNRLTQQTIRTYGSSNGQLSSESITRYYYDQSTPTRPGHFTHRYLTRQETINSQGNTQITRTRYPQEYALDASLGNDEYYVGLKRLVELHQVQLPIEQLVLTNTAGKVTVQQGQLTLFKAFGSAQNVQPACLLQLETSTPLPDNVFSGTNNNTLRWDSHLVPRLLYRYDSNGNLLEWRKQQQFFACVRHSTTAQVIAEAQNAHWAQLASTSFEPLATGRWVYDSLGAHTGSTHFTGAYGYQLDGTATAAISRSGLPAGMYELLVWCYGLNVPLVTGATQQQQVQTASVGDWHQYRFRLTLPTNATIQLNSAPNQLIWLDELRLQPVGALMTSYTHAPLVGLTSQTNPSGRTTFYEYDGLGRLVRTRDEQGRILSQQQYHYAGTK